MTRTIMDKVVGVIRKSLDSMLPDGVNNAKGAAELSVLLDI